MSQILALAVTGERFTRPPDFDLPSHWEEATREFERNIYVGTARVRASEAGRRSLREVSETVRRAVEAAQLAPDAEGWAELDIPTEEIGWAAYELARLGPEVEVLAPPELRERIRERVERLAALYGA